MCLMHSQDMDLFIPNEIVEVFIKYEVFWGIVGTHGGGSKW